MSVERNSFDKPREYNFHRELIQDPERLRDRIASTRDDEESFNRERALRENYSTSSTLATFGIIGSAANLLSNRPLGRVGLKIASKLTSFLNEGARFADAAYMDFAASAGRFSSERGFTDDVASALRADARSIPRIHSLQIFEDLENAYTTLGRLNTEDNLISGIGRDAKFNSQLQNIAAEMKEQLRSRYIGQSTSAQGVEELTIDKILAMSTDNVQRDKIVDMFGDQQIKDLRQAVDIGLLDAQQRIDKRIFIDSATDEILDTRILSGSFLGKKVTNMLGETQIPFVNLGLQDIFAAPIRHLFGEGDFSGIVRAADVDDPHVRRLVVGKNLYRINSEDINKFSLEYMQSNVNVRRKDGIANAVLARRNQLSSQKRRSANEVRDLFSTDTTRLFGALQEDLGIGRRFATQEAFIKRLTIDLAKRRINGTPVVKETTLYDDINEELSRRVSTSRSDPGRRVSLLERAVENTRRESRPDTRELSQAERWRRDLLAALGDEDSVMYVRDDPGGSGRRVRVVDPVQGTRETDIGTRPAAAGEVIRGDVTGSLDATGRPQVRSRAILDQYMYEEGLGSRLADVANFMTTRLNDLIGATTGLGFRPTPGMFGFAGNLAKIYGMGAGGMLALEGVKYLDYLTGVPTGGYKASNLLADMYGVARISAQFLREFTGLSPAARYMEDIMPGSIESSASDFARTIAPFAIALKMAPTKGNLLIATAISAAIGELPFTGLSQTPKETQDILAGEQLVPIRSGRYWMLGKQPFEGGKIQYFAPGMFARMQSEYKYTESLYGSQQEYFANVSFLPTPTNLFRIPELLGNVLSPATNLPIIGSLIEEMPIIGKMFEPTGSEYLAHKHRFDRPYPTAFSIEQVANRTVGTMASPGTSRPSLRAYQTPGEISREMGYNPYPARTEMMSATGTPLMSTAAGQVSELAGIYKFGLWDVAFKGRPGTPTMADPAFMSSATRSFYDESVGGLMGHTELLRRFVMSDYLRAQRQATNVIPNTMPTWLPGSRSSFTGKTSMGSFPGDRNYHIDFSLGDPYSKIPHGELRLPGAARERAFRLHSGSPGVYDAVDRFMVLADVAPNSEAYKHYSVLVNSMLKSGTVDEYWSDKILKTKEHVKQKLERYQTIARKFDGVKPQLQTLLDRNTTEKNKEGLRTYYTAPEQAVGTAWEILTHDVVSRVGISVPVLGPMLANKLLPARDELEAYIKREVYDTDEYDWTKPYATMLRPMHEQLKATDPLTATIGGYVSGLLIGANPIARIAFSTAGGMYFGARSSMRAIETGKLEGGYIPEYVKERRRMDEYFDNLEYIKYRRLEKQARQGGLHNAVAHFQNLKKRTVASLDYSLGAKQFVRDAIIALPTREKQLFMRSLDAPPQRKEEILEYVPEYLKPVYQAAWAKQGDAAYDYSNVRKAPDSRVSEYFMDHGMPPPDWAGFHPDVPMDAVRVKTMDSVWSSVGSDTHRMGIFGSTADSLRTEFPNPDLSVFNFYRSSGYGAAAKQQIEAQLMMDGVTDVQIDESLGSGLEDLVNFDMSTRTHLNQIFATAEQILRG